MTTMDTYTVVHFRREKDALEFQAEKGNLGSPNPERWAYLGEIPMGHVPVKEAYIYVNGACYKVADVTWSVHVNTLPGQPSFDDPQVMVTLKREAPYRDGLTPSEDFFR